MGKRKLKRKISKLKRKVRELKERLKGSVKLPVDRNGTSIEPHDTLAWDNGDTLTPTSLTYYGPGFEHIGCWDAMDDNEEYADNLAGSLNVTKMMKGN